MEIVDILSATANSLLYRSHPHLLVVEEEENDKPCLSGASGEKEAVTPTHSHSDDDLEIFSTPPISLTSIAEVSCQTGYIYCNNCCCLAVVKLIAFLWLTARCTPTYGTWRSDSSTFLCTRAKGT